MGESYKGLAFIKNSSYFWVYNQQIGLSGLIELLKVVCFVAVNLKYGDPNLSGFVKIYAFFQFMLHSPPEDELLP